MQIGELKNVSLKAIAEPEVQYVVTVPMATVTPILDPAQRQLFSPIDFGTFS